MERPTELQMAGAMAVLVTYARTNGGTAAENVTRAAAYSALSCVTGIGAPAASYADAVKAATDGEITITDPVTKIDGGIKVGSNPYGIPEGTYYMELPDDYEDEDDDDVEFEEEPPTEAELKRMTKDELAAQFVIEGATPITGTNAEMIKHILKSRRPDA